MGKTLFEKVWEAHTIKSIPNGPDVLYIDQHLIHEVTSPQAFEIIEEKGLKVFRPNQTMATVDHNVPTENQHLPIADPLSKHQIDTLEKNTVKHDIELYGLGHPKQGIVHVIAPELGITQPGMTIVCGDSHTSTHGALGAIAFGIGTSQVAQVFAAQSLILNKPKKLRIKIEGILNEDVSPKDIILYIISALGADSGTGYFCEFAGNVIEDMSIEGRMTICNMSIEMGARGGIIAPDEKTFSYLKGKEFAPIGEKWNQKVAQWKTLKTDADAIYDKEYRISAEEIHPMITYGTNPGMGIRINDKIPFPKNDSEVAALQYMGIESGKSLQDKKINYVFIGSCTNSRIEDFRTVATYIENKRKANHINALIVPGSQRVLEQIKEEGLEEIFNKANFVIRQPGCSACLAMNDDKIPAGEYCVSTSNRNFEGRQGAGSRTLLVSPLTAAKVAIEGRIN